MTDLPRRRDRSFWLSPLVIVGLVVVAMLLSVSAVRILLKAYEIRKERIVLDAKVRELEKNKQNLEAALQGAGSADAVERAAKEKLNLKNAGEVVVVIEPEKPATTTGSGNGIISSWLGSIIKFFSR